jgi:bifunctional ADP-heptose synthase (sugar kinase/adenylyltransferase)
VLGWGGEVRVADFVDGESTTGVIKRLGGGGRR